MEHRRIKLFEDEVDFLIAALTDAKGKISSDRSIQYAETIIKRLKGNKRKDMKEPAMTQSKLDNYVYVILWEESERGWGVRPDGYTLHIDETAARNFKYKVFESQPKDHVPDSYTRVATEYIGKVGDVIYKRVKQEGSIWGDTTSWSTAPKNPRYV